MDRVAFPFAGVDGIFLAVPRAGGAQTHSFGLARIVGLGVRQLGRTADIDCRNQQLGSNAECADVDGRLGQQQRGPVRDRGTSGLAKRRKFYNLRKKLARPLASALEPTLVGRRQPEVRRRQIDVGVRGLDYSRVGRYRADHAYDQLGLPDVSSAADLALDSTADRESLSDGKHAPT